ncbi:MAG: DNA primase [Armatimonadota bacterium]
MFDSRSAIDEIRSRLNILDVVSEYVSIKRAGKNLKGLCPFHSEKTPSFTVSEDYQSWHCFGCGEHGDVFSFVMKIENLTFAEVLERLAKRTGVDLQPVKGLPVSRKESLAKINSLSAAFYSAALKNSQLASKYLEARGIAQETANLFGLGFAPPDWDALLQHLTKSRVSITDAMEAGLLVKNDKTGNTYDKFRNRIIYPIHDVQERVIGFGGRAVNDEMPKYMNSPETPLFNKSKTLYGLNFARKKISETGFVIIVEGYMDVITAHQAGFTNCVATLGTALTSDHISILSRYTKKVVLAYDADSAGMKAALKGAAMFAEAESDVRIIRLPKGDDPDSIIRSGRSAEFDAAVKNALPITEYKLESLKDKYDSSTPAGSSALLKEAAKIIADVDSFTERERYIKDLVRYHPNIGIGNTNAQNQIRADIEAVARRKQNTAVKSAAGKAVISTSSAIEKAENVVLRIVAINGEGAQLVLEALEPDDFSREISKSTAEVIFTRCKENRNISVPDLIIGMDEQTSRFLSGLVVRDDGPPVSERVLQDCIDKIKKAKMKLRTTEVGAPFMKDGIIDAKEREQFLQKMEEIRKKANRKF